MKPNLQLLALRYLLVVLPGIATIYASDTIQSDRVYVFLLLGYLLLIQRRDRKWEPRFSGYVFSPLLFAELAALTALTLRYEGLLPIAYLSVLFPLVLRQSGFAPQAVFIAVVMNVSGSHLLSWEMLLTLDLAFFTIALLLYRLVKTSGTKSEIEALYDELKLKHYDLEETRKTVVDYANKVQELAQIEERNRIAHDLHDDLGHKLIRLKMMLEAATRLGTETGADNQDKAMEMVREVRDQLGESMESLRATVRRLKPARSVAGRYSLESLIDGFARESGIAVNCERDGMPYPLYPSDEFILYRNAQEAITNAVRHGGATEVTIVLAYAADRLRMSVSNNGSVPDVKKIRKGLGLMGMEDRARIAGGSVEIVTEPRFEVVTVLNRRGTIESIM